MLVGISSYAEEARWGPWQLPCALLPLSYAEQVAAAGGVPVLLPPLPGVTAAVGRLDALILSGGGDLDPAGYGAQPEPETSRVYPERDRAELDLLAAALAARVPVLGICRGLQILNVSRGGTLQQHLPERVGHDEHRRVIGSFAGSDHEVALVAGSLAARAAGESSHQTLSHHHQGVDRLGDGLIVSGASSLDELPEAIELPDRRFVLGVQWHPEADTTSTVIAAFVTEAAAAAAVLSGHDVLSNGR